MLQTELCEIRSEVYPFVLPKHAHGQTDECPEMQGMETAFIMLSEIMYLSMTVVARGDGILSPCCLNLVELQLAILTALFGKSRLEKASSAAATVVVRFIWRHINEVFRTDNLFHHIPQVIGDGVAKGLSDKLAGILNGKGHFQLLVPVRVDRQFSFPDPFCVILNDAGNFEVVFNVEFFQSGPDCK